MRNAVFVLFAVLLSVASGASLAHRGHYYGPPIIWSTWYPPVYYPAPVIITTPPVYVEPRPTSQQYWYYCGSSRTYFPYVRTCPEGWMRVVPQAPPQ